MNSNTFNRIIKAHPDHNTLCRFCLETSSKRIDFNCSKLFKLLTNEELKWTPNHPKSICTVCEAHLESAIKFRIILLQMEQCWNEYIDNKYVNLINLNSDEHIYDEIYSEIGTDFTDSKNSPIDENTLYDDIHTNHFKVTTHQVQIRNKENDKTHVLCNNDFVLRFNKMDVENVNKDGQRLESSPCSPKLNEYLYDKMTDSLLCTMHSDTFEAQTSNIGKNNDEKFSEIDNHCNKELEIEVSKDKSEKEKRIKCVIVGDAAIGKSNLIISYLESKFVNMHIPTASDVYNFEVKVNDSPVLIMVCDTAGQDSLCELRKLSYPNCNVFLLCFSVVQPESFYSIKSKWAPVLYNHGASFLLVGTQSDLRLDPEVNLKLKKKGKLPISLNEAWDLAVSLQTEYIETSSLNKLGVKDAFDAAIWIGLYSLGKNSKKQSLWKKLSCLS